MIQEIREYAIVYYNNIRFDDITEELPQNPGIERMNALIFGLENSTLIPYVLFVLKNTEEDEIERNKIFAKLISYKFRN